MTNISLWLSNETMGNTRAERRYIINVLTLWWWELGAQKHPTGDVDDYDDGDGIKGTTEWNKWIVVVCSRNINLLLERRTTRRGCPRLIPGRAVRTRSLADRINISEMGLVQVFFLDDITLGFSGFLKEMESVQEFVDLKLRLM